MNLFDLLKEHAGMSQEEAENYFHIENTAEEWTLKSIRYLEPTKFRAVVALAKEYGGDYDATPGVRCIHIPKPELARGPVGVATPTNVKLETALGHVPEKAVSNSTSNSKLAEATMEEYDLDKSVKTLGKLTPVLKDAHGNVIDGLHRLERFPDWPCITVAFIDTPEKLEAARLAVNTNRRLVSSSEITMRVEFLAKAGLNAEQITAMSGLSKATIYRHMPKELKPKGEAISEGRKEQVARATSETVTTQDTAQPQIPQRIQRETLNELVECANCHMGFHISKATLIDNKNVCPRCAEHVKPQPKPKIEPTPFKPKETGDYRVAQMHPKVSKMDTAMLVRLQNNEELRKLGWRIEFQKPRTKVICISDVTLIDRFGKEIDVYFDFVETHKNSEVEDDFRRQEAARIHKVEVIPLLYDAVTETEERRLEKAIVEQLKIRGVS